MWLPLFDIILDEIDERQIKDPREKIHFRCLQSFYTGRYSIVVLEGND